MNIYVCTHTHIHSVPGPVVHEENYVHICVGINSHPKPRTPTDVL